MTGCAGSEWLEVNDNTLSAADIMRRVAERLAQRSGSVDDEPVRLVHELWDQSIGRAAVEMMTQASRPFPPLRAVLNRKSWQGIAKPIRNFLQRGMIGQTHLWRAQRNPPSQPLHHEPNAHICGMVNQFHPAVHNGDAIGEQIANIRRLLLGEGYQSEVFCVFTDEAYKSPARLFSAYAPYSSPQNVLLLHYSIGYPDAVWEWLRSIPDRKIVIYHNITPPRYFAGVNTAYFVETQRGLRQLARLRRLAPQAWADSSFNAHDLQAAGWRDTKVLPIIYDRSRYNVEPDPAVLQRLDDGRPNVLFVGRCAPNKRWEDVLLAYYYLKRHVRPDARLCLVGSDEGMLPYRAFLDALVSKLGLTDVVFAGHVSQAELAAYYRTACAFLCMSEHEGFCVPLVESMHYRVPIIAYAAAAVPETLGGCGLLVRRKDYAAVAEAIGLLIDDPQLRDRLVERQSERVAAFDAGNVKEQLRSYLREVSKE